MNRSISSNHEDRQRALSGVAEDPRARFEAVWTRVVAAFEAHRPVGSFLQALMTGTVGRRPGKRSIRPRDSPGAAPAR